MNQQFENFVEDLKDTHGDNLVSVVLYGSAAAGDFLPHESDYNILIVLEKIAPIDLRNAHACAREWNRLGHPVPVYFTEDEIASAGDVFPIEFHYMENARKVLYGRDVLAEINISDRYLRHQTEFELRSNLLKLRRRYIHASTSVEALKDLMSDSLTSFSADFRAVLLLIGKVPPIKKHDIVQETVRELRLHGEPFEKIFDIRENNASPEYDETSSNELFGEYLIEIERVIAAVNSLETESAPLPV
ncbi:MAG: nucleotidyltransferase domain-containing protein [Pyrinomonadaceae bacterium]|nr:nucleotidyltransferase domain-containing protein [Pyrinomonadaceae bacterium]